jgi:hypothetical protein
MNDLRDANTPPGPVQGRASTRSVDESLILEGIVLEGVVTTLDERGEPTISPMGPRVREAMDRFVLRPFKSSRTFANLERHGEGVFHVTDDVELIARGAIGLATSAVLPALLVRGCYLPDSCRAYEFRIVASDLRDDRASFEAEVLHVHRLRDFFGFHRARHAVIEAAILATRLHLVDREAVLEEFARLRVLVEKTGGEREHRAFRLLEQHVARHDPARGPS